MEISYLMLGSNVGDRKDYLRRCIDWLHRAGTVTGLSAVYESEPWGFDDSTWFLNQAVALATHLTPGALLENIQKIEQTLGRTRTHTGGYQSRTMDIDILLYGNLVMNLPELVIPHPRMTERMFVLQPMAELAPDMEHPVLHRTMTYLREQCKDRKIVRRVSP